MYQSVGCMRYGCSQVQIHSSYLSWGYDNESLGLLPAVGNYTSPWVVASLAPEQKLHSRTIHGSDESQRSAMRFVKLCYDSTNILKTKNAAAIATCIQQNLWFTSAAKSVLISPIAVSPTRNEICIKSSHTRKARQRSALIKGRPLKINYFQSFWLWIASKHQEWFVPEFSCAEYLQNSNSENGSKFTVLK